MLETRTAIITIENFPEQPVDRQYCFVWNKKDGSQVVFGCDTKANCEAQLQYYQSRAIKAEQNNWDAM